MSYIIQLMINRGDAARWGRHDYSSVFDENKSKSIEGGRKKIRPICGEVKELKT